MYKTPSSDFFWTKIHLCSGQVPGSTGWGLVGVLAVGYVSSLKHSYTIWFACTDFPLHATRKDVWWRYLPFGCRSVCSPWSITKWSSGTTGIPRKAVKTLSGVSALLFSLVWQHAQSMTYSHFYPPCVNKSQKSFVWLGRRNRDPTLER